MLRLSQTLKARIGRPSTISPASLALATTAAGTICFVAWKHQSNVEVIASPTALATSPQSVTPQRSSTVPTRSAQISTLLDASRNKTEFDVLIIGGGATGAGAALDATTRGLSTVLIERGDFGNETSARSTKLIWAGIRYIATATSSLLRLNNLTRPIEAIKDFTSEFRMVSNCHKERRLLLENNPHLTNWVPIAVPVDQWFSWPPPFSHPLFSIAPIVLPAVFKFYDSMSGFTCPHSHIMSKSRADRKFPQLATEEAKYYSVFYEGSHNDARTATYIALTAAECGACVTNYTEMVEVLFDEREGERKGRAIGVKVKDHVSGQHFNVYAKSIVFAGGPFTDSLRKIEDPSSKPSVAAAAGTHIVLPAYYCSKGVGMLDINTSDGRFLFFLPWQGKTLVGTTDRKGPVTSCHGPPEEEIQWLLNECKKYLAHAGEGGEGLKIRRTDVLSAWQGFRPLASDPNAPPGAPVSRDHVISHNPNTGITFITGGKWTTYREMAEDVIDRVVESSGLSKKAGPCVTEKIKLRGGVGYTRNLPIQLVQQYGVSQEVAEHLARTYGTHAGEVLQLQKKNTRGGTLLLPGYPYLEQEIEYACQHEMTVSLTDVLTLRTRLAYLDSDAAASIAPKVADLMSNALGWSRKQKQDQINHALEVIGNFGGPVPKNQEQKSFQTIEEVFHSFDVNKTGYIDYEELKLCMKHFGAPFKNEEEAQITFNAIDKNSDGKITEDEFLAWWKRLKRNQTKTLSDIYRISSDKLGSGSDSRGAAFG